MRVSASKMDTWQKCQKMAQFKYVDKLPQRTSSAMVFGTCVHSAMEFFAHSHDREKTVEWFLKIWDDPSTIGQNIEYWTKFQNFGSLRERGVILLEGYFERFEREDRRIIAVEHPFKVMFGDHEISGYVDLLEYRRSGRGKNTLRIVDYKGLPLDTLLPTPTGWTTMGEVGKGDRLIGSDGKPCVVLNKSEVHRNPCMRLKFDDGSSLVADFEHRWSVELDDGPCVLTTEQVRENLRSTRTGQRQVRIPQPAPLQLPKKDLPLDPWVLGYWLGNGKCSSGEVSYGYTYDVERVFKDRGYALGADQRGSGSTSRTVLGIRKELSRLGLLGSKAEGKKHVPPGYLRGSKEQRLLLLQGLMDSDGSYNPLRRQCVFVDTNQRLAEAVVELVVSLGWRCSWWEGRAEGFGKVIHQYKIAFRPQGVNPFLTNKGDRVDLSRAAQQERRLVVSVEDVPIVPTACVEVDSQDHTYLAGQMMVPTHNTGKKPYKDALRNNLQFCADEETEILTRRGWMRHDELVVGEEVLTLNQSAHRAEWQPAETVNVFDADDQDLLSMEGKAHSSLTTMNHRWPVIRLHDGLFRIPTVKTSEELTGADQIYCAAPVVLPATSPYDDDFVELLAWAWTEGWLIRSGESASLALGQSFTVNPDHCLRMEACLTRMFGEPLDEIRYKKMPCWRLDDSGSDGCRRYYLNRWASESVLKAMDWNTKAVDPLVISQMTEPQLRLFYDVSMMADRSSDREITQSVKARLDSFQTVVTLLGMRSSLRRGDASHGWRLSIKSKRPYFVPRKEVRSTVKYTGKVWCPTTQNQTWLARRNGHVYYTGNTAYHYASLQPEFWIGYPGDPDFPGLPDGARLYQEFKHSPRQAVWWSLATDQEIDAGERTQADFNRMYLLVTEMERAMTHEVFMPCISGETCSKCDFTQECGVEIPSKADRLAKVEPF